MKASREELALQVDEAEWGWLRPHLERGGIIVISHGLDLANAGAGIAGDNATAVQGWIASGLLGKPTAEQIGEWDADQGRRFRTLIVSPFILIQEITIARA